jgi:hypothetical protein
VIPRVKEGEPGEALENQSLWADDRSATRTSIWAALLEAVPMMPAEFAKFIVDKTEKWKR